MDCFVAEPAIGPRFARTRWLLAMTVEEAAGISKFKTRKRLAEAKLESARQNLARVFDILEEVTRQLNSLKRQASKTRRYGELKAEMDAKLRLVLAAKFRHARARRRQSRARPQPGFHELRTLSEDVTANEQERERLQTVCATRPKRG